jgi:hypothetical protein
MVYVSANEKPVSLNLHRYNEVLCFEILWTILIVLDSTVGALYSR